MLMNLVVALVTLVAVQQTAPRQAPSAALASLDRRVPRATDIGRYVAAARAVAAANASAGEGRCRRSLTARRSAPRRNKRPHGRQTCLSQFTLDANAGRWQSPAGASPDLDAKAVPATALVELVALDQDALQPELTKAATAALLEEPGRHLPSARRPWRPPSR